MYLHNCSSNYHTVYVITFKTIKRQESGLHNTKFE